MADSVMSTIPSAPQAPAQSAPRGIAKVAALQSLLACWAGRIFFRDFRGKQEELDLARVKSVLIVRLDEIGDFVMFTPMLRELRRAMPHAKLTLLVKPSILNLVERCPYVDEVLTYDPAVKRSLRPLILPIRSFAVARKKLWKKRFDLAILPRWDTDSYYAAFVAYFSGARWRIGFSEKVGDRKRHVNRGFDRLLTHPIDDGRILHDVEHNLDVVRSLGAQIRNDHTEVWVDELDRIAAQDMAAGTGLRETLVCFGPSGGHSALKRWPLENFAELGRWLIRNRCRVVLVGGPREEEMGRRLADEIGTGVINAVGKTTLRQMAALVELCDVYVGNDSGPMHVAAAVGTPVIALFGSSSWNRFRPWGERHIVLKHNLPCSPWLQGDTRDRCPSCIHDSPRCMEAISVEEVKATLRDYVHRERCIVEADTRPVELTESTA